MMIKNISLLVGLLLFSTVTQTALAADLNATISNVRSTNTPLVIGLFDKAESFPKGQPFKMQIINANRNTINVAFSQLPPGQYALAVYQDLNRNGRLDRNFLGIPSEPYGFSGRNGFGRPNFNRSIFNLGQANYKINLRLR